MRRVIAVIAALLMIYSCFGQRSVNSLDCNTMTSIMNNRIVKNFLHSHIDRIEKCVFENNRINTPISKSLSISCKSFEIENRNYKILDSAEVTLNSYVPNQIIQIIAFETNKAVLLYLEWMETGAEFQVIRDGKRFQVKLIRIDRLD